MTFEAPSEGIIRTNTHESGEPEKDRRKTDEPEKGLKENRRTKEKTKGKQANLSDEWLPR
jgi:hypothetical protein